MRLTGCRVSTARPPTTTSAPADQARARDGLARAHRALDQADPARQHWRQALGILAGLGIDHTGKAEVTVPTIRTRRTNLDEPPPKIRA